MRRIVFLLIFLIFLLYCANKLYNPPPIFPVSSDVNKTTIKVLRYISDLNKYGKVLSGQNIDNSAGFLSKQLNEYFDSLFMKTGYYPAIMGIIYCYGEVSKNLSEINSLIIDYRKKGGLITINITTPNPFTSVPAFDNTVFNYDDLFNPDSSVYQKWYSNLDLIAAGLQELREKDVTILFHPLYEMNGGWSWWCSNKSGTMDNKEAICTVMERFV